MYNIITCQQHCLAQVYKVEKESQHFHPVPLSQPLLSLVLLDIQSCYCIIIVALLLERATPNIACEKEIV
jgi:hypothetical protein